jgi:cytochrome c biogenesis protein
VLGARLGFKGFIFIPEGYGFSFFISRSDMSSEAEFEQRNALLQGLDSVGDDVAKLADTLKMPLPELKEKMKGLGVYPLDFTVRCDKFEVQYYEPTDMPKAYRSLLTVIDGGREVMKKWIEVNDPLKYKGVTFYQSSYRLLDNFQNAVVILGEMGKDGKSDVVRVKVGEPFRLSDGTPAKVTELSTALQLDEMGRPFTYSKMMVNPAVKVEFGPRGVSTRGASKWIFKRKPESWILPDGGSLRLVDIWGIQATGLQVRKDPGVWVVYLGCICLSLGLFIAFFLSHKKLWVRVVPDRQGSRVQMAGYAHKGRYSLEAKIEKMKAALKEGGKK